MSFGEYSLPTDTLAAILGQYPFSVGLFRELLQNTDDARGSKQIFVLDTRNHGTTTLVHDKLGDTQGPALLVFNDAFFSESDWDALQSIHRSSKKTDSSKIGKYGIGFRSCYHITDNPQVISGSTLAILDPHHHFTSSGGTRFEFPQKSQEIKDQLDSFDFFLSSDAHEEAFPGSIIRLPLRKPGTQSSISSKSVDAIEIRQLFDDFIREEIGISLLFLKNVTSVEVHQIDPQGIRQCLAKGTISRSESVSWSVQKERHTSFQCTTTVETPKQGRIEKTWRIVHSYFHDGESTSLLSLRLGHDPRPVLAKHKLLSEMAIAIPLSILDTEERGGRLFTYLPLPLRTGFPGHVHALFALTASRQNLNNGGEIGIVRGSEDSVLVEWNYILFESFLPRTWTALLKVLLQQDQLGDVFRAWPPAQSGVFGGDTAYWQALPAKLLECIVLAKAEVWPVFRGSKADGQILFAELGSVLLAPTDVDDATLLALTSAGLRLCKLPEYIFKLINSGGVSSARYTLLSPAVTYRQLLTRVAELRALDDPQRLTILEYLLRGNQLENIAGLPLLPLIDGTFCTPVKAGTGDTNITIMDQLESDIFGRVESQAVSLPAIPPRLRDLLRSEGPTTLNLILLSPQRVAEFLHMSPLGFDLTQRHSGNVTDALVGWLNRFWAWVGDWPMRDDLFSRVNTLCLVPADTSLESPEVGVFSTHVTDLFALQKVLQGLGIAFLHPSFSVEARKGLGFYPLVLKSIFDIHLVLDRITVGSDVTKLDADGLSILSKHVVDCMIQVGPQRPLNEEQQSTLRSLPIFPLLQPSVITPVPVTDEKPSSPSKRLSAFKLPILHRKSKSSASNIIMPLPSTSPPEFKSIPTQAKVYGIPTNSSVLLPTIDGVVYLDGAHINLAILGQLSTTNAIPLLPLDILNLAVEHFIGQKKTIRAALLDYINQNRDSLPPNLLKTIQQVPFVAVLDGTMRSPSFVVDPTKPELIAIYAQQQERIPAATPEDIMILRHLRDLNLINTALTLEMVTERIEHISLLSQSNPSHATNLSFSLLATLHSSDLDCSTLYIPFGAKWLPTDRGLVSTTECFDSNRKTELFDEVLAVLDPTVAISESLRKKLGWDQPLHFRTLRSQFEVVVIRGASTAAVKLDRLIRELSERSLTDTEMGELRTIVVGRQWVPIAPGRLASTDLAIFSTTLGLRGFHRIPASLAEQPQICNFLARMGCTDRPSAGFLVAHLRALESVSASRDITDEAIALLSVIAEDLKSVDRAQVLVPDNNGTLRPISEVFFNDVGDRAFLIDVGKRYIAHPKLSDELSKRLIMDRLGFSSVELTPGIDMGETLTTTIRNTLKQYSEAQIINEFFANACDAEANKFGVLIDDFGGSKTNKLLSAGMAPFVNCPSIVIYNNGKFTAKDFEGICRTGIGGKADKTNTIGQFGLGALSMFHFTEMAMIVSGTKVMFLDPSKNHLPIQGRASLLLPLDQVKRWYPDHLQPLDGLFDFSMKQNGQYHGTIFRLPLRRSSHILTSNAILTSPRNVTAQAVWDKIVRPFKSSAQLSLLFTSMDQIAIYTRDTRGHIQSGWTISASRDGLETVSTSPRLQTQVVRIRVPGSEIGTEEFKVVYTTRSQSDIPSQFSPLVAPLSTQITYRYMNLFSALPLPLTSTLPVHLTASFILSPDRRNIRLDEYGSESKYNRWLLSDVAPPLYMFLLEDLLRTQAHLGNAAWWPGNRSNQDAVSQIFVDAFYSSAQLGSTKRRICASVFETQQFRPNDVLLGSDEPVPISKVLGLLNAPHIVRLPSKIRERAAASMKIISPLIVKNELKDKTRLLASLFQKGEITTRDIQSVVDYLCEDRSVSLDGLGVLPLANGKLAVFGLSPNYFVWKPTQGRELFKSEYLVAPDFVADKLLDRGLNVSKFKQETMDVLIKQHFRDGSERHLSLVEEEWVRTFWAEYPSFGLPPNTKFTNYPLVRTTKPGRYVSMGHSWTINVVLLGNSDPYFLAGVLSELGLAVVIYDSKELAKPLRDQLKAHHNFTFDRLLHYFQKMESSIDTRFSKLPPAMHAEFAEYARNKVISTPESLIPIAAALPIWKKLQKDQETTLHKASSLKMLPFGISRATASHFIGVPSVEYNAALVHLKVVPMDFNQFWTNLKLPTVLSSEEQTAYKQLLTAMPSNFIYDPEAILLPDGNRRLVKAKSLYVRHALFVAAFGSDESSTHFVLDSFRDLEPRLVGMGLRSHTNLDIDTFKECARSIQAATEQPNITSRARVVFRAYAEDMPLRITTFQSKVWKEIDRIQFAPREPLRSKTMALDDTSPYVKPLPTIVAPDQVLLADNEAIAWTQRAILLVSPDERLLRANPSFGQPTPREVVEHLRVLALRIAKDFTSDVYVLSDLEATYKWLDDHQDEVEDEIIEFHDEPLFLNVDDPKSDPWVWHSADEMFFNIMDGGDLKSVKKSLLRFRDLLSVAGVEDIIQAPVPGLERSSIDTQLGILRRGFQMMREEGKLTDVVFVCDDETRKPAHRAWLAPMSEYLNDLFCGSFTEAGPGTADDPIVVEVDYSGPCVETVLDFMYTVKPPSVERLDDLLDVMDLSNYWGLEELNLLVQAKIIGNSQISPATYEDVLERATALDAKLLLDACEFFAQKNKEAILRLKGELSGKRRTAKRLPKKSMTSVVSGGSKDSDTTGKLKIKPIKASKTVAKGILKGLRKVGDSWDFMS
ncbi:BTB domain-containing protein [Mycena indigotica]|uniref:BTB domain-containing protein n=1 Tax=Mycena indigotica TaxID=2126181 RepID=A0A8H6SDU5_9AGAR|nr:BTB domain-containing protein [Mycena indigotica]KAF7297128.1 BTB domain-containing protein [Mycena indigotica]